MHNMDDEEALEEVVTVIGDDGRSKMKSANPASSPRDKRMLFEELFETTRVRNTWKQLRKELTKSLLRDCIDFAEFDLFTADWIKTLCSDVVSGAYQPIPPTRREESKSAGAFRVITTPSLKDGLIYRHICDYAYELARPTEWMGAFFSRRFRKEVVGRKVDDIDDHDYLEFFEIWRRYAAYRKHIGLGGLYRVLVVTDLTNYFESVQHELLYEHLGSLGIPRKALGVLGKLLDVLRPDSGHSASPAVGLPTDEIDCSRTLAHVFLFEHDREIANFAGNESYVRWMDDQNIGVASERQARMVVRQMVLSLSRQRLTLNTGKTKFLSPSMVSAEFWLDLNTEIDNLELILKHASAHREADSPFAARVFSAWSQLTDGMPRGHWDKVAKRLLLLAAKAGLDVATKEQCRDLLVKCPQLATRIFDYLVARGRYGDHLCLFKGFLHDKESLCEDVEIRWFESLLSSSPPDDRGEFLSLAKEFLSVGAPGSGRPGVRVSAALLLYWFDHADAIGRLAEVLGSDSVVDGPTRRTITAILCARRPEDTLRWLSTAATVPLAGVSGLIAWILGLRAGSLIKLPKLLVFPKRSAMTGRYHYDARIWLRLELLLHSPRPEVLRAVNGAALRALKEPLGELERKAASRIQSVAEERINAFPVGRRGSRDKSQVDLLRTRKVLE